MFCFFCFLFVLFKSRKIYGLLFCFSVLFCFLFCFDTKIPFKSACNMTQKYIMTSTHISKKKGSSFTASVYVDCLRILLLNWELRAHKSLFIWFVAIIWHIDPIKLIMSHFRGERYCEGLGVMRSELIYLPPPPFLWPIQSTSQPYMWLCLSDHMSHFPLGFSRSKVNRGKSHKAFQNIWKCLFAIRYLQLCADKAEDKQPSLQSCFVFHI